jgi:uncharacterized protein YwqG
MRSNTSLTTAIIALILTGIVFSLFKTITRTRSAASDQITRSISDPNTTIVRTEDDLKARFENSGILKHWDFFKSHLRNEILAKPRTVNEDELTLGQSKIGGQPDLPKNIEWFKEDNGKRLSFIGQINLSEVTEFDRYKSLPSQGLLYFFYSAKADAWGFDIKDKDKFKVFYYDGPLEELQRKEFPADLVESSRYKPCKLSFQSSVSLPNWGQDYVSKQLNKKEIDKYLEATEYLNINVEQNKLLGHSDNIQGPMELQCQLVTNGLYCGDETGYNDPKAKELKKGADDWILLFQVDSNYEESGMIWGDAGMLYFWIRKDDLKNKRFDKCWLISQCA